MSETADAVRRRLPREAARRREAAMILQVGEATCRYGASVLLNGAGPAEAREAAIECAAELSVIAEALRKAVRLGPAERRARAVQLAALGWSRPRIAVQLGISERVLRNYLRAGGSRRGERDRHSVSPPRSPEQL